MRGTLLGCGGLVWGPPLASWAPLPSSPELVVLAYLGVVLPDLFMLARGQAPSDHDRDLIPARHMGNSQVHTLPFPRESFFLPLIEIPAGRAKDTTLCYDSRGEEF